MGSRQFRNAKAAQLSKREGFQGLENGCDVGLTLSNDHSFNTAELGKLMVVRSGAFITDDAKSKCDTRRSPLCLS